MDVTAIIPTRNRSASLRRVLGCLERQTAPPSAVIIVDASDDPEPEEALVIAFPALHIRALHTSPGLCAQRNRGIASANSETVFLCDDDIEFSPTYLSSLMRYLAEHPDSGAVSGEILERDATGAFVPARSGGSVLWLLWSFLFQLTVWRDLASIVSRGPAHVPLAWLKRYYASRGNTFSIAGWPLVTRMGNPVYTTSIYGLGAAVIRRSWLLQSPFDEDLHPSGIGDNYGVAIGFPGREPIAVIADEPVRHHREPMGRVRPAEAFALRVFALDRFLHRSSHFTLVNRLALRWSLVGYLVFSLVRADSDMVSVVWRTFFSLLTGRNPYLTPKERAHD